MITSLRVPFLLLLIFDNEISPGKYFTFLFYSFFLFGPLQEIGNVIIAYREAEVSLLNFSRILSLPKEVVPQNPVKIGKISNLTFDRVSFKHQSANTNALNDISFSTEKGETIAFVGPSGSGKTTLVKLLVGLYPPKDGRILYNNVSSGDINLNALREKIGFVTQDTQLFSGTIRENLLFVRPNATDEECMSVLQKAACQSLLARADKGLDTVIGEGGVVSKRGLEAWSRSRVAQRRRAATKRRHCTEADRAFPTPALAGPGAPASDAVDGCWHSRCPMNVGGG